jgi:hypothetical protein
MDVPKLTQKVIRHIQECYPCPKLSSVRHNPLQCPSSSLSCQKWLSGKIEEIVDVTSMPYFDYEHIVHELHESIRNTSLQSIAVPGTGLTPLTNPPTAHGNLEGPLVLEIVHIIESGVCAFDLEEVRQERARIAHQGRVSTVCNVTGNQLPQERVEQVPPRYPRNRLKLILTDGFIELEAVECEHLPDIVLGETTMGTKVRLLSLCSSLLSKIFTHWLG